MLKRAGIKRGFITGRYDGATESRLDYLGVDFYLSAIGDKGEALTEKINEYGIDPSESLFVGDDVNDIPAFKVAGVSIAVANAPDYIKKHSDIVTTRPGGQGAVREVVDMILEAKKIDPVALWLNDKSIVGKQ
ncbi:3-deoxy-D-manno-octulosonate 8-phosphate phosphatase KdsC [subsurface metagenome]